MPCWRPSASGCLISTCRLKCVPNYPHDHVASPAEWTAEREAILDQWVKAGKLVLTIDYSRIPEQIDDAYARARARGYVPFVTVRSLGLLVINKGHEPD